ncbi:MAG: sugar phosphate nucleotidyltransferase [Candidatus Aenigmatarchaeota archaeon]
MQEQNLTVIAPVKGKGTRLYPLTLYDSKSLVGIANQPALERIFENLTFHGCRNFWIIGEYELYFYFRRGEGFSKRLGLKPEVLFNYSTEEDLGNADGTRKLLESQKIDGNVLIIGGDNLTDINVQEMLKLHENNNADLTVALAEVKDVSKYGIAKLDGQRIVDFIEKPGPEKAPSNLGSMFCYLAKAQTLKEFLEKEKSYTDFGSQVIPKMVKECRVYGYVHKGYWNDIGSPENLLQASLDILDGKIGKIDERIHPTTKNNIGDNVEMENVLIGANVKIGNDVKLKNVCIEDNCVIEDGAEIENSMLYFSARVGEKTKVRKSIIGRFAYTGKKSVIGSYEIDKVSVVGNNVKMGDEWLIWAGELLTPYSPKSMKKIKKATINAQDLYKIINVDNEIIFFVSRKTLYEDYKGTPPPIFRKF